MHIFAQATSRHKRKTYTNIYWQFSNSCSHAHTHTQSQLASAKHIAPAPSGSASKRELGVLIANRAKLSGREQNITEVETGESIYNTYWDHQQAPKHVMWPLVFMMKPMGKHWFISRSPCSFFCVCGGVGGGVVLVLYHQPVNPMSTLPNAIGDHMCWNINMKHYSADLQSAYFDVYVVII